MSGIKNILKWQGGKSGLFENTIKNYLSPSLFDPTQNITFIDGFAGGGSVFMYVLYNCLGVKRLVVNDYNTKLIRLYYDIREQYNLVWERLKELQDNYNNSGDKNKYYLDMRKEYNNLPVCLGSSVLLLALNRTCFNGIYRENGNGEFNVSWGKRDTLDYTEDWLKEINTLMNSKPIYFISGDFEKTWDYITNDSFIYLDPPYRPLSGSSSFTSYTSSPFNDKSQERVKLFCDKAIKEGANIMVSNSYDPNDDFLLKLWKNYTIIQIEANRSSGGKGAMRGSILENLIKN